MFSWLKRRRRRKLAARPVPDAWRQIVAENFPHAQWLTEPERTRLFKIAHILLAEKFWEGCAGLVLTDEIRVTIAAQAALLLLGFEHEYYDRLVTILVYPGAYMAVEKRQHPGGVIEEGYSARQGEAWTDKPVVLSWPDVLEGGRNPTDGKNLVFHEFAHVLDGHDLFFDGTPDLLDGQLYDTWRQVMAAEYRRHLQTIREGRFTLIDRYGAENPAEFFAVATECFFERPRPLADRHPQLYEVLRAFYKQDPAERMRDH
jgi:Mlc titration factor MtfA (ptsG expression regulator)